MTEPTRISAAERPGTTASSLLSRAIDWVDGMIERHKPRYVMPYE